MPKMYCLDGTPLDMVKREAKKLSKEKDTKLVLAQDKVASLHGFANWQDLMATAVEFDEGDDFDGPPFLTSRRGIDEIWYEFDLIDIFDLSLNSDLMSIYTEISLIGSRSADGVVWIVKVTPETNGINRGYRNHFGVTHIEPENLPVFLRSIQEFEDGRPGQLLRFLHGRGLFDEMGKVSALSFEFEAMLTLLLRQQGLILGDRIIFRNSNFDAEPIEIADYGKRCFTHKTDGDWVVVSNGSEYFQSFRWKLVSKQAFEALKSQMETEFGDRAYTTQLGEIWMYERLLSEAYNIAVDFWRTGKEEQLEDEEPMKSAHMSSYDRLHVETSGDQDNLVDVKLRSNGKPISELSLIPIGKVEYISNDHAYGPKDPPFSWRALRSEFSIEIEIGWYSCDETSAEGVLRRIRWTDLDGFVDLDIETVFDDNLGRDCYVDRTRDNQRVPVERVMRLLEGNLKSRPSGMIGEAGETPLHLRAAFDDRANVVRLVEDRIKPEENDKINLIRFGGRNYTISRNRSKQKGLEIFRNVVDDYEIQLSIKWSDNEFMVSGELESIIYTYIPKMKTITVVPKNTIEHHYKEYLKVIRGTNKEVLEKLDELFRG